MDDRPAAAASWSARRDRRVDDVLAFQRAARKGGTAALLAWLAARTGGEVGLVGPDGARLSSASPTAGAPAGSAEEGAHAELARRAAAELRSRALGTVTLDGPGVVAVAVALDLATDRTASPATVGSVGAASGRATNGAAGPAPRGLASVLTAVVPAAARDGVALLLADAAPALGLCLREERAEERLRRLEVVESRNREAVLHLLMNGHVSTARQVAEVLGPTLPDVLRFHVVAVAPRLKDALVRSCAALMPEAWVIPCPVYADHILVLVPTAPGTGPAEPSAFATAVTAAAVECSVGVSDAVPVRDTSVGYAQAFHALVNARTSDRRWATFGHRPDPALLAGVPVRSWAGQLLRPLHAHVPQRPQDPDSTELAVTVQAWLAFASGAASLLKIHRNTLAARLRHVEQLLGVDLDRLADQSRLVLALRALGRAHTEDPRQEAAEPAEAASLDELLGSPAMTHWARQLLGPLDEAPEAARTLATWLRHDARLTPTATELSISPTAVRKRLARVEEMLGRSLLRPPSDRHELWLATRTLALAEGGAAV